MPVVYTMEGGSGKARKPRKPRVKGTKTSSPSDGSGCYRVKHGKKPGCTIALCPGRSKKGKSVMKFKRGSVRCT